MEMIAEWLKYRHHPGCLTKIPEKYHNPNVKKNEILNEYTVMYDWHQVQCASKSDYMNNECHQTVYKAGRSKRIMGGLKRTPSQSTRLCGNNQYRSLIPR